MRAYGEIEKIKTGEIYSRIGTYILLGEIDSGKTSYLKGLHGINYFNFEDESQKFFEKTIMTVLNFDLGKFFKEIKKISASGEKILIVDNMEIIINILYSRDGKQGVSKFFKDSINQVYKQKVIFVFSEIKDIWIEKCIKESGFPEKNIVLWGKADEN